MKRLLSLVILLLLGPYTQAQDSCALRISLLTCTPGEELYSTFGHTAIRITDRSNGTDIVYNYGTFDFEDPDFYAKFVRGKLKYYLSRENFTDFVTAYQMDGRGVYEQLLNLDCAEKSKLQQALFTNLQGENRYYRYDFLFDNCTTRARDIIFSNATGKRATSPIIGPEPRTFRTHLHAYLNRGEMFWSKLGIDILLGSKLDRAMTNDEAMFLPDYLAVALDSTRFNGKPEVTSKTDLVPWDGNDVPVKKRAADPPTVPFALLLLLFAAIGFLPGKIGTRTMRVADFILYFVTGLLGLLLTFMWFGTDHALCGNNYNLLWAIPTHVFFAFLIGRNSPFVKRYFFLAFILSGLSIIMWFVHTPQYLPDALLPLFILLTWRNWKHARA